MDFWQGAAIMKQPECINIHEDCELSGNTAKNSSAKSIILFQFKEANMNPEELKGKWNQIKGQLREKWAKLTDDDWEQLHGDKEKLVGKIQERYGIGKEQAEKQLHEFFNKHKDHH